MKGELLTCNTFFFGSKSWPRRLSFREEYIVDQNLTHTHVPVVYKFNIEESGHSLEWYTEKFYDDEVFIESNRYFKISAASFALLVNADEIDSSLLSDEEKSLAIHIDF